MIVATYRNAGERTESTKAFTGAFKGIVIVLFLMILSFLVPHCYVILCYYITAMSITYLLSIEF